MNSRVIYSLLVIWQVMAIVADDLDGFVPGFRIDQVFIPSDCTHRAREGDYLYQQYTGYLEDGTKFDSSYDRGDTYNFHLGVGEVIRGMDMGMKGMCKGEKRKITIPPELGYGDDAVGSIPPGSTLIFEVELADVESSGYKMELLRMPENCTRRSAAGDFIREHYNGTFLDGSPFDSSYDRNQTYDFTLGERQVIKGVDMGLMNMCEGERRRLTVPPILAYGDGGYGDIIPPHTTIVFEAELVEIVNGKLRWYKVDGPECSSEEAVYFYDTITILYNGFTESKLEFSSGENETTVYVGGEDVLYGLTEGVIGMCIGERRRLRIPPELAVADINGAGIPQHTRITLDVELVDVQKQDVFKVIDANGDKYLSMEEVEQWLKSNPEFADLAENEEMLENYKAKYFTGKDVDKNNWVSRNEFYGYNTAAHDEL